LIRELQDADLAIVNDSAPMHLAALLGVPTVAVARIGNIEVWRPPGIDAVCSPHMPTGYHPANGYTSDEVVQGWPEPEAVLHRVRRLAGSGLGEGVACP
jgi:ADP-heptose:LPS heptosyltransferase